MRGHKKRGIYIAVVYEVHVDKHNFMSGYVLYYHMGVEFPHEVPTLYDYHI